MSPETHLLASWIVAAKTTDNPRDCRLVTLAGILPDADGLGLLVDASCGWLGCKQTYLYFRRRRLQPLRGPGLCRRPAQVARPLDTE